ncbi:alpha/beta hydrolase [Pseudonocardia sp. TRM90224]|uniref:alpha/beta hydrolase n=1 Tax=Pseudonocardia sp. TRM90224 TaxID=2812678 RepID=UPI001E55D5A4|nr:alpha/beta hydrolase [Pseudonocardia sp. TRM90224]
MNFRTALLGAATVAVGVTLARAIRAQARALEAVLPELRGLPLLRIPLDIRSNVVVRLINALPLPVGEVADGVELTTHTVAGRDGHPPVQVHVYGTAERARPSGALLWIHGGGYVLGDAAGDHALCSRIARDLGITVVNVNYRLAPADPFPAGLEDCYTGLRWLHDNAEDLGVDPDRIAIGGESAGGGLAAALAQLAHDRGEVPVCFQLLVYPMLDDRTTLDESQPRTLVWSPASNMYGWTSYLGHRPGAEENRPYAVPARREDLSGLPPAWIGVGDLDLFHAEDTAYAGRLAEAGVPCQLEAVTGVYHGVLSMLPDAPTVVAFRRSATDALAAALAPVRAGETR